MATEVTERAEQSPTKDDSPRKKPRIDWEDPSVPVGNSPPLPHWPVFAWAILWAAWIVGLAVLLMSGAA